ncbi:MAG: class I SAM-dependent methyltransferase, partial [Oscillospiraceae bacterium]|nr:class I SAM-dependent methyltransferase [Oscillospiraceae bacterium]
TIDGGNFFDWGRVAKLYSKSRNIYPEDFWNTLNSLGVGQKGQKILDIGTGTGILPLNMQKFGGRYTAVDKSPEMIFQAKGLAADIDFICVDAHDMPFDDNSFDVITALQCWVYFDKEKLFPELDHLLKSDGSLYIMFMTWLPEEDEIIRKSFGIIKKYNVEWSGYMKRFDIEEFNLYSGNFSVESVVKKDYYLPFTRESWCDRLTASRGVGAALTEEKIKEFRADLMDMLDKSVGDKFTLLHEAVIIKLKR